MSRIAVRSAAWWPIALGLGAAVGSVVWAQSAASPQPVTLASVAAAMRADAVTTIEYSGSGYSFGYQQAPGPGEPWPLFIADTYRASIDYAAEAMRLETTRAQGEKPPRGGGGQPVKGNPRSITFVRGGVAWSQSERGVNQPTPNAIRDRVRQLWMTPHGIVKAAVRHQARVNGRTIELTLDGLPLRVAIGSSHLVDRIEYTIDSPVLGDVSVQLVYQDYKTVNGVPFPTRILEKTDGFLTLDVTIADVKPGAPVAIAVPSGMSTPAVNRTPETAARAPSVSAVVIAPGVWQVTANNYASMLVEFRDFLVMFEAPLDDARSAAVHAWVTQTVPGKPTRYVVNTHAHFDHAGGLRWYAAEGVTIVTHEMNRSYYEQVWSRPRTLRPDRLSQEPRPPLWDTMTEKKVITDGSRTLELHKLIDNGHNPYLLIGYLPGEQVVLYGDMYNPPPGDDPRDLARTNEYAESLYDNIANRLKLSARTLVPVHGRAVPFDNLKTAIGR